MHCLFVKYIQFCKKMSSGPPPKRLRQIFLNFKRTFLTASMLIICAVDIQVNWNFDSQKALWLTPVWTAECDKFCSSAWDSTVKTFTASGGGALPPDPLTRGSAPCPRWGLRRQTAVIGSRSRARHVRGSSPPQRDTLASPLATLKSETLALFFMDTLYIERWMKRTTWKQVWKWLMD